MRFGGKEFYGSIGFDGLSNNTHLINEYYWVTHLYSYAKV